jgi:hypothetical protein
MIIMFSTFPSRMLTSMVSIWLQQGSSVQSGAIGPLFLGSQAVSGYALLYAELFPVLLHSRAQYFLI